MSAIAALLFATILPAAADQCQWVTVDQARAAAELLGRTKVMAELCEPCGQSTPTAYTFANAVSQPAGDNNFRVKVVGARAASGGDKTIELDLAYTYIPQEDGTWVNLAAAVGCPATGVSPTIAPPPVPAAPGSKAEGKAGGKAGGKAEGKSGGKAEGKSGGKAGGKKD
jgi:hypothetical protein